MNNQLFLMIVLCLVHSYSCAGSGEAVSSSIGSVMYKHDRNLTSNGGRYIGPPWIIDVIKDEYQSNIESIPVKDRVEFLWSVLMHVKLGSHEAEEFDYLIHDCCSKAFKEKLDSYIPTATEKILGDKYVTYLSHVSFNLCVLQGIDSGSKVMDARSVCDRTHNKRL